MELSMEVTPFSQVFCNYLHVGKKKIQAQPDDAKHCGYV
jgi:hypothetical protein